MDYTWFIYTYRLCCVNNIWHPTKIRTIRSSPVLSFSDERNPFVCDNTSCRRQFPLRGNWQTAWTTGNGSLIFIQKVDSPWFVNMPSCRWFSRCTLPPWERDMSGGDSDGGKRSATTRSYGVGTQRALWHFWPKVCALHFNGGETAWIRCSSILGGRFNEILLNLFKAEAYI